MDYNTYFLKQEAEMAKRQSELKAELEQQVEEQLAMQMEAVCAFMRPQLIASWEKGGLGEEIYGEVYISILKGTLSKTYQETLNALVHEKIREYGFTPYFNCAKEEAPEIAILQFNFSRAFYGEENDWCSHVAREYFNAKAIEMENTLHQMSYFYKLSCAQGKECPFGNKVELTVKLPQAARKMLAKRICDDMSDKLTDYVLEGLDKIIFGLSKN